MSGFSQAQAAGKPLPSPQWSRVMPLTGKPPWLTDARRAIARVARLAGDWDGDGSPAVQQQAIFSATSLLDKIDAYDELPVPNVGPIPGGGLGINWHFGKRDLELEFLPDGSIEYLKSERTGSTLSVEDMQDGTISPDDLREARRLVRWLMQGC